MRNLVWLKATGSVALVLMTACGGGDSEKQATNTPTTTTSAATPVATTAPTTTVQAPAPKPPLADLIKKTMADFDAGVAAHDAAKAASAYAADVQFVQPGPMGWHTSGKDDVQKNLDILFKAFPDLKIVATRSFLKGNEMAVEGVMAGTNTGEFMGHPATGKKIGHRFLSVLTFNDDGLIKTEHLYHDHATMMSHLGHGDAKLKFRNVEAIPTTAMEQISDTDNAREAKNTDAVKAWLATWEKKDDKAYTAALADDVTKANYMHPADIKGKDAAKKAFDELHKTFPDVKLTPTNVLALGDWVVVEVEMSGTMKGDLGSVKSTGKPGTVHLGEVIRFNKDGKIAWASRFGSRAEWATAFGIPPKMPAAPGAHSTAAAPAPKK
ncbi:MAG TPA: nuclear transport factor 2 family protein [Polyangiaceae bacterium]|jgi:steroid delta-isomerase-like uncharacterized protein